MDHYLKKIDRAHRVIRIMLVIASGLLILMPLTIAGFPLSCLSYQRPTIDTGEGSTVRHTYSPDDFIGTWKSADGGQLLFESTVFRAEKMPLHEIIYWRDAKPCSGSGTWKIDNDLILLTFTHIDGTAFGGSENPVQIKNTEKSVEIYFVLGDPDGFDYYTLHKEAK